MVDMEGWVILLKVGRLTILFLAMLFFSFGSERMRHVRCSFIPCHLFSLLLLCIVPRYCSLILLNIVP